LPNVAVSPVIEPYSPMTIGSAAVAEMERKTTEARERIFTSGTFLGAELGTGEIPESSEMSEALVALITSMDSLPETASRTPWDFRGPS